MSSTGLAVAQEPEPQASVADDAFPEIYNSETEPGDPISPQEALAALHLPEGFTASLFAAEPTVQNPIATCVDELGQVWIAENYTYAERSKRFDMDLNDRVVVLQDTNSDGNSDKRTVFIDNVKMLTGITKDAAGVWLMCPPQLLFVPDADGDLVPDGPPEVRLDGFHVASENYHNFANGLSFGPDGWLYGRCGASCPGEIGLPGTTQDQRVPLEGGMWRFHPERRIAEALTHGTTNPWGHDWNSEGELFFINTVNGHLWHAITGAHFVRPHTLDNNPYSYELLDMHADHWHFDTGKSWTASRAGAANDLGGGHAHIGMMINHNLQWPEKYHGRLFTVNMHGRRINTERLERHGSGYVGRHDPDFVLSDDEWFRGMDVVPCPDGSVIVIDWSDTGECHDHTGVHRRSGRIFKIQYGSDLNQESPFALGSEATSPRTLARLSVEGTEWQSRHARRLLQAQGRTRDTTAAQSDLHAVFRSATNPVHRLRALWALFALDDCSHNFLAAATQDSGESVRCWAIRLMTDHWLLDHGTGIRFEESTWTTEDANTLAVLLERATNDPSALVRLTIASTLQRLPHTKRIELAEQLMTHADDAADHNLPLMVWYGLSPLGDKAGLTSLIQLLKTSQWPKTRQLIARRIADQSSAHPDLFADLFRMAPQASLARAEDIFLGVAAALEGRRQVAQPETWEEARAFIARSHNPAVSAAVSKLNVLFGDGRSIEDLVAMARSGSQPLEKRVAALQSLVSARAPGMKQLCLDLLNTRFLNSIAAQGLAELPDPNIGRALVGAYRRFHPSERSELISIVSTRSAWAGELLTAVANGRIPRDEISAFQARQIASLQDATVDALLLKNWGRVRASSQEKRQQIDTLRSQLDPATLAGSDKSAGRAVFAKNCAVCHKLYGIGATLGPDLTGAQRTNLDYLLENIVDPSAVVTAQFRSTSLLLEDGRALSGLLTNQTERTLTLATQQRTYSIPADEVLEQKLSENSTMPDGVLTQLSEKQIRDLFGYLQSTQQVALPESH